MKCDQVLEKVSDVEYKNLSPNEKGTMHGMIRQTTLAKYKINVLLIDDIFDPGRQVEHLLQERNH